MKTAEHIIETVDKLVRKYHTRDPYELCQLLGMLVADLPALIWYLAHTSACFNEATAHIQISPVGFMGTKLNLNFLT